MQEESDKKARPQEKGSLFPDLAPYGQSRHGSLAPKPEPKPLPEDDADFYVPPAPRGVVKAAPLEEKTPLAPEPSADVVPEEQSVEDSVPELTPAKPKKPLKLVLIAAISLAVLLILGSVYFFFIKPSNEKKDEPSLSETTGGLITIPIYYPKNLPGGYTFNNDGKALKKDVYYFSVSGPNKQTYYITEQAIAANFDFKAFEKKFSNPDTFTTEAGTVTLGPVGANILASIRTAKNTWIIINASPGADVKSLDPVARSFKAAD